MDAKKNLERRKAKQERIERALLLRQRGLGYRQIAAEMGYANVKSAFDLVQEGLAQISREAAEEVRTIELNRLDEMLTECQRVIREDRSNRVRMEAVDRVLRIMERRAKYLGLDAPSKVDMTVSERLPDPLAAIHDEAGAALVADLERYLADQA